MVNNNIIYIETEENIQKNSINYIESKNETKICLNKINRCLSYKIKRILILIALSISVILFVLSFVEIFAKFDLMNKIYFFIFEILITLTIIFFTFLIVSVTKKIISHIPIICCSIVVIILCCHQIAIIIKNKYTTCYLVCNWVFCLSMTLSLVLSFYEINKAMKTQRNVMQNIEEIINFTDINEEKEFKKNNPPTSFSIIEDGHIGSGKKSAFNLIEEENKDSKAKAEKEK